jgi:hypothetical protein
MKNETINRILHEKVMGLDCWHNVKWNVAEMKIGRFRCKYCKKCYGYSFDSPDYCTDLNAVALAEAKVIEKIGLGELALAVLFVGIPEGSDAHAIFAPARQRAEAVLRAAELWEETSDD